MMISTFWVTSFTLCVAVGTVLCGCARQPEPEPSSVEPVKDVADSEVDDTSDAAVVLTEADNGKTVALRVGETMVVKLEGNVTTGYSWGVDSIDDGVLKIVSSNYEPHPVPEGWTGGGGTRTMRFVALQVGETKITLSYRRPWEEKEAERTFEVTVQVDEPG